MIAAVRRNSSHFLFRRREVSQTPYSNSLSTATATTADKNEQQDRCNELIKSYFTNTKKLENDDEDDDDNSLFTPLKHEIHRQSKQLEPFLIATRRNLHQHPELMYELPQTSSTIQNTLSNLNISSKNISNGWAKNIHPTRHNGSKGGYGIVADIGNGKSPCVLLRADMDALPIHEMTKHNVDDTTCCFKSQTPGIMHACGHDAHMTMLLGAASILQQMSTHLPGTIRLMFQPAEEGGAGAKRMIEEGILSKHPPVQAAYGLHVWPTLPSGSIGGRGGVLLAAADRFDIVVNGDGGHAAMPHLTNDPILAASAITLSLQSIVSRNLSPLDSGVVSITKIQAGEAFNVIPSQVQMKGTIRSLSMKNVTLMRDTLHRLVEGVAAAHGCDAKINFMPDYYPPTHNDEELWKFSSGVAEQILDSSSSDPSNNNNKQQQQSQKITSVDPTMAAEDFSFLTKEVPSTFFLLGSGSGQDPPTNYGLHHPQFALDESVMARGVELHVNLALRTLKKFASVSKKL